MRENQHRRLRAGTAVGIERHGIRVDAGNGLDADIARDIFSGDRDLAGGAVERVVCRVEHLITDGHIGIGGVAPHRRVVGQLIALVRDEPCGVILSLLGVFFADDARSDGGDENGIFIRGLFPLRVDHGIAVDLIGKIKRIGIRLRPDCPAGERVSAVHGLGRQFRHAYGIVVEETGGEAQHLGGTSLRREFLPVGAEGDVKKPCGRRITGRAAVDSHGTDVFPVDVEVVLTRLRALTDVIGAVPVGAGGLQRIYDAAGPVAVLHKGAGIRLAAERDLFVHIGVLVPHGAQCHAALHGVFGKIPCVRGGVGNGVRRPMDEVVFAILAARRRGFGRGNLAALRHGDACRSRAAVAAHIERDGDHRFFSALRRGGKRQQRKAERKYKKQAEQTFFHIIPSL